MKTVLLVDADTIAFKSALSKNEDGSPREFEQARVGVDKHIRWLKEWLFADDLEVILTDPKRNFRKDFYPPYKSHRDPGERPPLIDELKQYLREAHKGYHWPGLEADDVQGIIATGDPTHGTNFITISIDKDLKQIPGKLFNPDKWNAGLVEISPEDGMKWTWVQTITGDNTDGYPGIPGVGPKGAEKVLGLAENDGISVFDMWPRILQYYHGKGHTTEYALSQLRCARILQSCDYDLIEEKITLWTPPGHPQ